MTIFENPRVHKNQNIEKIIFRDVQMKFSAMLLLYKKISFDVENVSEHDFNILVIFGIKLILTHALVIATNIPVRS